MADMTQNKANISQSDCSLFHKAKITHKMNQASLFLGNGFVLVTDY